MLKELEPAWKPKVLKAVTSPKYNVMIRMSKEQREYLRNVAYCSDTSLNEICLQRLFTGVNNGDVSLGSKAFQERQAKAQQNNHSEDVQRTVEGT